MRFEKEIRIFRIKGGLLRAAEAAKAGIHPQVLARMEKKAVIEKIGRGLYRLDELPPLSQPDIATVALKVPQGILCLISALSFHDITTQVPREVHIALKAGSEKPRIDFPPVRFFWLKDPAFRAGIEEHTVDGVPVKVYSPEKTVADCFKFRNRIGIDIAIEALKLCRSKKKSSIDELMESARIDRVEKVMKSYLESIV